MKTRGCHGLLVVLVGESEMRCLVLLCQRKRLRILVYKGWRGNRTHWQPDSEAILSKLKSLESMASLSSGLPVRAHIEGPLQKRRPGTAPGYSPSLSKSCLCVR